MLSRLVALSKRLVDLRPPITQDRFITWVGVFVSALAVVGGLRLAMGPEHCWSDPLEVIFGILAVVGAGALGILVPSRLDVMSKVGDRAKRLRSMGVRIQSDAFRLFVDERLIDARIKRELDGGLSTERAEELKGQYLDVCYTTTDAWMRIIGECAKQVNNICDEVELKGFTPPRSLHLLRQFMHAIITAEMKRPQLLAWRNRRWAEISQRCFVVARDVDAVSYSGMRGAPEFGDALPYVPPEELNEIVSWVAESRLTSAPELARDLLLAQIGTTGLTDSGLDALSDYLGDAGVNVDAFMNGEALFESEGDLKMLIDDPSFTLVLRDEIPSGDSEVSAEQVWLGRVAVAGLAPFCVLLIQAAYVSDGEGGGRGDGQLWEWIVAAREWVDIAGRFRPLTRRAEEAERVADS